MVSSPPASKRVRRLFVEWRQPGLEGLLLADAHALNVLSTARVAGIGQPRGSD